MTRPAARDPPAPPDGWCVVCPDSTSILTPLNLGGYRYYGITGAYYNMSENKTRISASLPVETKEKLDEIADEREANRSVTLTQLVDEWERYREDLDATRTELDQVRGQLAVERERRVEAEQAAAAGNTLPHKMVETGDMVLKLTTAFVLGGISIYLAGLLLGSPVLFDPFAGLMIQATIGGFGATASLWGVAGLLELRKSAGPIHERVGRFRRRVAGGGVS